VEVLKNLRKRYFKPIKRRYLTPWLTVDCAGVRVSYKTHLDGGGSTFGQEFIPFFRRRGMPKQTSVFEWCAGPGFIGFSMLGNGLCDRLYLSDVNPEAVAACRRTVQENGLIGRVIAYQSDNLTSIPSSERWDLVVSNPPHFVEDVAEIRFHDPDWRLHRAFFRTISRHLKANGVVVLQENDRGSTAETFRVMIEEAGLSTVFVEGCPRKRATEDSFYFLGIMRQGETPPAWATFGGA